MMNSRSNKKSRSTSNRGGRGKAVERQLSADGVYANHRFMQAVGALVGLPVQVITKTKEIFEGVFTTFGPELELVLDLPHLVSSGDSSIGSPETVKNKMIFAIHDIVFVKVTNVDMDYATKEGFAVDSAISKYNGQIQTEKELEPWHGEEAVYTDLGLGDENANGWDADDMFKKNEEKYGVTTTYSPEMEGYTTPLQKKNTKEWKEQEAKAQQIASEIEHSPVTQTRADVENGEDEEEKFSAVIRPEQGQNSGKYMPPQRRKIQDGRNKQQQLPRGTPSPQSGAGAPQLSNSGRYNNNSNNSSSASNTNTPYNTNSTQSSSMSGSASGPSVGPSYTQQNQQLKHHQQQHSHNTQQSSTPSGGQGPQHHSIQVDSKLNGEPKEIRRLDNSHNYIREPSVVHKESYHSSEHSHHNTHSHHSQSQHSKYAQQSYQSHNQSYNQQHPSKLSSQHPPQQQQMEPSKGQRDPRKPRNQKDEQQMADLKKFQQDFKLAEPPTEKKVSHSSQQQQHTQPPPSLQQQQQPSPPQQNPQAMQQQHNANNVPLTKVHHNTHTMHPPPQPASQPPPQVHQVSSMPSQHHPSPVSEAQHLHSNIPAPSQQPTQQQQSPPQPHQLSPQPQPMQQTSPPNSQTSSLPSQETKSIEEENPAVLNSKLNPNAKEFILNPNAKPFNPRSPSTTTPPRVQTPQIVPTQPQIGSVPPSVGFQQNMVHYVMAQPFPVQSQTRFPKRGPGSNHRADYASSMQVAAATGHPLLAPSPLTSLAAQQSIPTVPIPQNMMQQAPQHYGYSTTQMFRMASPQAIPMITTMVPTSMGMYYHGAEGHQNSQGHTPLHMYVTPGVPPHQVHQPHPVANPGPHPGQPPTPQGHSNQGGQAPPPNMPTQPPTPGPTPPQTMMYGGPGAGPMGGQPTIQQHLPQHSPHTGQSPHNPYSTNNAALAAAAAAAASHHTPPHLVMLPPHLAPHVMPPGGAPPPHSGSGHIPSSAAGYTPTSSAAMQHINHGGHSVHYIHGTVGNAVHPISLLHHNQ